MFSFLDGFRFDFTLAYRGFCNWDQEQEVGLGFKEKKKRAVMSSQITYWWQRLETTENEQWIQKLQNSMCACAPPPNGHFIRYLLFVEATQQSGQ